MKKINDLFPKIPFLNKLTPEDLSKYLLEISSFVAEKLKAKIKIYDIREELPRHKTRKWNRRKINEILNVLVHQGAGHARAASAPGVDCKNTESVNLYHINPNHVSKKGCPRICYLFSIERDGKIEMCNDYQDITWHSGHSKLGMRNRDTIGIIVCGNFSGRYWKGSQEPTEAQLKSLKLLCEYLIEDPALKNITGWDKIKGHCDANSGKPDCPGTEIMENIERWRKENDKKN